MSVHRIRLPRPPKLAEPIPTAIEPPHITQDDHGRWGLGWGDDVPGDFPTRRFARDYWLQQSRHQDRWVRQ
jgi:hypothetical protein